MEVKGDLVARCIEAASENSESVERWRRQVRTLERMPSQLAQALLHRLLRRRLVFPSLLEVFKHSIEELDLTGEKSVDAEWMAYVGAFCDLRSLSVTNCRRITNSALWSITGMTNLKELNLSRCLKFTDAGIQHLLSIPSLEKLWVSETGLTANGVKLLSALTEVYVLDLGGLPVNDVALHSLQVLTKLQHLDLWGSKISDKGTAVLKMFPKLSFLNLAWTNVTKVPHLPSLACLNMSDCTIHSSVFEGNVREKVPLEKFIVSGASFMDELKAFSNIDMGFLSFLDASNTTLHRFSFLPNMNAVEHLDLSFNMIGDDSVELIAYIGANIRNLNLSNTRVSSAGVGILAEHVPNLEIISLCHTLIDDAAISYISKMSALRVINLSNTNIKGFVYQVGNEPDWLLSLTALQCLHHLERLDLVETLIRDAALYPLSCFQELSDLSLSSVSLTDMSLYHLSSVPKLKNLSIRDAVLTNGGLDLFNTPAALEILDLSGCWLLTKDAIMLFCAKHPQIELRHDLVHILPSIQKGSYLSFPQVPAKYLRSNEKRRKMPTSCNSSNNAFIDQRLKYSREELLAMNYSSLCLKSSDDRGTETLNVHIG